MCSLLLVWGSDMKYDRVELPNAGKVKYALVCGGELKSADNLRIPEKPLAWQGNKVESASVRVVHS